MNYLKPQMLKELIADSVERREELSYERMGMNVVRYLMEMSTIRLNLGRCAGHTTAMLHLARPWDVIFVMNQYMVSHIQYETQHRSMCQVLNIQACNLNRFRGLYQRPKTIWVDNASYIAQRNLDDLYHVVGTHPEQTFVLLG